MFAFIRAFVHPGTAGEMHTSALFKVRLAAGIVQTVLIAIAVGKLNWQCAVASAAIHLADWVLITYQLNRHDPKKFAGMCTTTDEIIFLLSCASVLNFVFERPTRHSSDTLLLPEHWLGIGINCLSASVFAIDYYYVLAWTDAWGCYETSYIDDFKYGYCPGRLGNYDNSEVCRQYEMGSLPGGCINPAQSGSAGIPPMSKQTPMAYWAHIAEKCLIVSAVFFVTSIKSVLLDLRLKSTLVCDTPTVTHSSALHPKRAAHIM